MVNPRNIELSKGVRGYWGLGTNTLDLTAMHKRSHISEVSGTESGQHTAARSSETRRLIGGG
jgi:hypothetical protein